MGDSCTGTIHFYQTVSEASNGGEVEVKLTYSTHVRRTLHSPWEPGMVQVQENSCQVHLG